MIQARISIFAHSLYIGTLYIKKRLIDLELQGNLRKMCNFECWAPRGVTSGTDTLVIMDINSLIRQIQNIKLYLDNKLCQPKMLSVVVLSYYNYI